MPNDAVAKAEAAYEQARAATQAVQLDLDATVAHKAAATAARDAMFAAYAQAALDDLANRTAFLNRLLTLLQGVTASIEQNPMGDLLARLNSATTTVMEALAEGSE